MNTVRRASASTITGAFAVVAAVLMLAVMGRAVTGLVVALFVSYLLGFRPIPAGTLRAAAPAYFAAVGAHVAHFIEEYRAGFYDAFPPVVGAAPWSRESFLLFNLLWLLVFGMAAMGLLRDWQPAIVIALFLAIGGGLLNGVAHIVLAAAARGYFPGLYTAPLVLGAGSYLAYRLLRPARVTVPAI